MKKCELSPTAKMISVCAAVIILLTAAIVSFSLLTYLDVRTEALKKNAETASSIIERAITENKYNDIAEYLSAQNDMIQYMMSSEIGACSFRIADKTGKIIKYVNTKADTDDNIGECLTDELIGRLKESDEILTIKKPWKIERGAMSAVAVRIGEGDFGTCGYIVITSGYNQIVNYLYYFIFIAAMIAVWILFTVWAIKRSYKKNFTIPMQSIRQALVNFSAGKFDYKVEVPESSILYSLACVLNETTVALYKLDEAKSDFLSSVSHDLRTPMTTMAGFVDCILSGSIPKAQEIAYLESIKRETMRLSRLVVHMLDMSRMQNGVRQFVCKEFDICEMLRQVFLSFEGQIEYKKLKVIFKTRPDNCFVWGDQDGVNQVVYNLIDNAIKFCPDGGLIRVTAISNGIDIKVVVYNEGPGIEREDLPHIFERFYKGDRSRGKERTGFGLGLYISQQIMGMHGRKIFVTSNPGTDCMFGFTLPIMEIERTTTDEKSEQDDITE